MALTQLDKVQVELTVVVGRAAMPIRQLLQMGRGAVVVLDAAYDDDTWILANGHPIARGRVHVDGDSVQVVITDAASVNDFSAASQSA